MAHPTEVLRQPRGIPVRRPDRIPTAGRVLLTVILAAGGTGIIYEAFQNSGGNNNNPDSSHNPGGITGESPKPMDSASPTIVIPTPSFEVSPSPSPEVSPTPEPSPTPDMSKWWNQIPEDPYKDVNKVPLHKDSFGHTTYGDLLMEPSGLPGDYILRARTLTIVKVTPDIKDNVIWVDATTGNNKFTKSDCKTTNFNGDTQTDCDYSGGTYRFKITGETKIFAYRSVTLGQGLDAVAKYLKAGESIGATIALRRYPANPSITSSDVAINKKAWATIRGSVGKTAPARTAANQLTFNPAAVIIDNLQQ